MILLTEMATAHGDITLRRDPASGALFYAVGGRNQSAADSAGISLAGYIHAF